MIIAVFKGMQARKPVFPAFDIMSKILNKFLQCLPNNFLIINN